MDSLQALKSIQELINYTELTMAKQNPSLANATKNMLHTVHTAVFDAHNDEYLATSTKEKVG